MTELVWPTEVLAHSGDYRLGGVFKDHELHYREPQVRTQEELESGYGHSLYPRCSFCGSVSPEGLMRALEIDPGLQFQQSDLKYGWPHKFYVDLPIPPEYSDMGLMRTVSGSPTDEKDENGRTKFKYTIAPMTKEYGKFYNEHLNDITDQATFEFVRDEIAKRTGYHFEKVEGKLMWAVTQ